MIKNYIFDFGNVLAEFNPEKLVAPYISDEETKKHISSIVFDRQYWDKLDLGTITNEEVKTLIKSRVPHELKEISCTTYDNWINNLTPVRGMQDLVKDIHKKGKKMYVLSSISKDFRERAKKVEWIAELFKFFDGMVFSGEINIVKPDAKIFEYVLETYKLDRKECLFIDDSEINIKGAEKVGIKGYLFDGNAEKLRKYIGV